MVELVLEEAATFKRSIDAISVLVSEAEFIADKDGLSLKATDPSQISLVDFSLAKDGFKTYSVKEKTSLGVDLNYLSQLMARARPKDELSIKLDEGTNNISLVFRGASVRSFSVPLLDITSAELPTPRVEFDSELKVKAQILQDSFKDASLLSSHIALEIKGDTLLILADSSKGNFRNEITKKDGSLISIRSKAESKAMFPLEYLSNMLKAARPDTEVSLSMKKDAPIRLEYAIGKAAVTYFLAPRIESE
jgi:proliferating cell nuclear antigen